MRIDRRRKLPVSTLLMCLDNDATAKLRDKRAAEGKEVAADEVEGMSAPDILDYFYDTVAFIKHKRGWQTPLDLERMRGIKLTHDLINAKSGRVVLEEGTKITPRVIREVEKKGIEDHVGGPMRTSSDAMPPTTSSTPAPAKYSWRPATRSPRKSLRLSTKAISRKSRPCSSITPMSAPISGTRSPADKNSKPRRSAGRHLPGHAPGRAADPRDGGRAVPWLVLRP